MNSKHLFSAVLEWPISINTEQENNARKTKNHFVSIERKDQMEISAAKAFKGDPSKWNPEDMLLSSLMSCHMMSYLYCCQQENIRVISYSDTAEAVLQVNEDGSGLITLVTLKPKVVIEANSNQSLAHELHFKAHDLCFIANSCKFPIQFEISIALD